MPEMTPPEARTYHMLLQVCQTHLHDQDLSLLDLYTTVVIYLGEVSLQWLGLHDTPDLVAQLMAALTERLRTRLASGARLMFDVPGEEPVHYREDGPSYRLHEAMAALSTDAAADYQIEVAGGIRIALSLLADVLHTWSRTFDQDEDEILEIIASGVRPGLATYLAEGRARPPPPSGYTRG